MTIRLKSSMSNYSKSIIAMNALRARKRSSLRMAIAFMKRIVT
jgi:hypothetical protein